MTIRQYARHWSKYGVDVPSSLAMCSQYFSRSSRIPRYSSGGSLPLSSTPERRSDGPAAHARYLAGQTDSCAMGTMRLGGGQKPSRELPTSIVSETARSSPHPQSSASPLVV